MRRSWRAAACLSLAARVAGQAPIAMPFSQQTFGPDGPWSAVEIKLGSNQQALQLLPGGWFESIVLSPSACNGNANCPAQAGGLFDANTSSPAVPPGSVNRPGYVDQWSAGPETNTTGTAELMADTMTFSSANGKSVQIPNFAVSLADSVIETLPNGTRVPASLGFLALGGNLETSSYQLNNGTNASGQMLPNYLASTGQIPSASFGLHVGTATFPNVFGQPGSLVLGGYDQSRAIGDVGEYALGGYGGGEPVVPLVDMTIGVATGGTPFNTTQIGSLYRNAAQLNTSEPLSLNPTVPYMQLPIGMCEAVAEFLPVTFDAGLGMYLWNVDDPQFSRIVKSPAFMAFAFARSGQPNLLIQVPFSVLNLTLTPPLAEQPTQYFPCKPSYTKDDKFYLGRAFLQAAYLTINWEKNVFTLSQGSGPDNAPANIVPIQKGDTSIGTSNSEDFLRSWTAHWLTIPDGSETGISPSAKAGIAVGAISGAASLISVAIYFVRRHNRKKEAAERSTLHSSPSVASSRAPLDPAKARMMREAYARGDSLPPYPGATTRPWYASGMRSVKEMDGSDGYMQSSQYGALSAYGSQSSHSYGRNIPNGYSHGSIPNVRYTRAELGHTQINELGQTQITELQARSVALASPHSPVEISGREVGVLPFAFQPEPQTSSTRESNVSPPPQARTSATSSHRMSSSTPHPRSYPPRSSGRPSITRNSKGFWEISPVTPLN